ncbi:alpha/beta hydrolase [Eubacteriales bacterium OttesenSCG-928-N14]|nr:alpha/beta hydrolase [Eubacteriales bacterium OttesenSCG-928-N14]
MSKRAKIILFVVLGIFVLVFGVGIFAGNYFYNLALNPNSDKSTVLDAEHNAMELDEDDAAYYNAQQALNEQWLLRVQPQDFSMITYDGLTLYASQARQPQPSDKWLIAVHGYMGNSTQMVTSARNFYERGYNVITPDCRGHGKSEGNYIGMGWDDRLDMVKWIEYIIENNGQDVQIVLYGVSMGVATVMMTAGEDLPPQVKAIVEDCGYTSAWDEFAYQLDAIFGLPAFPLMNFANTMARIRAGYDLRDASATKQLQHATVPVFFIHGSEDTFVPSYMLDEVYEACASQKDRYLVQGAGHGGASFTAKEEYWQRIDAFLARYVTE